MDLIADQVEALKSGNPVRVTVPELGGDVVLILAAREESLETVLEESLADVREKKAWAELAEKARAAWAQENPC